MYSKLYSGLRPLVHIVEVSVIGGVHCLRFHYMYYIDQGLIQDFFYQRGEIIARSSR